MNMLTNPEYLKDLRSDSPNREMARRWNTNESTIRGQRARLDRIETAPKSDTEVNRNSDGSIIDGKFSSEKPMGFDDFREFIRKNGQDPDEVTFVWGVTSRPGGGFWNKINNVRPKNSRKIIPLDDLTDIIEAFRKPKPRDTPPNEVTAFLCLSDLQIGKVDENGNTVDTVTTVMDAVAQFVDDLLISGTRHVVIVEGGDIIEGFCNTKAQAQTNDRSLTEQIRIARRVMLRAIILVAEVAEKVTFLSVPSNHAQVRDGIGRNQAVNKPHDDFGLEISYQLEDALELNPAFDNVRFVRPINEYEVSLNHTLVDGTNVGLTHGDVFGSPEKAGTWWAGQDHGRGPVSESDILIHGHYHNLSVRQSGNARWIIGMPTADNGSSWYSIKTGERSLRGVLAFNVYAGQWNDLRIL